MLRDFQDYLRVRDHVIWDKDSKEARFVRKLGRKTPQTIEVYRDQQIKTLGKEFIEQGGLRERMTRVRRENRNRRGNS